MLILLKLVRIEKSHHCDHGDHGNHGDDDGDHIDQCLICKNIQNNIHESHIDSHWCIQRIRTNRNCVVLILLLQIIFRRNLKL